MQIGRLTATLLTACTLGTSALACPTANDMAKGAVFKTDEGGTEVHKAPGKDWVRIIATFADGEQSVLELDRGIYLATSTPVVNGKPLLRDREDYGSAFNLRKWADPAPSSKWRNDTADGGRASSGPLKTARIGKCRFQAFEVTIDFADESYREVYLYLAELKTGLLIESDDGKSKERYKYTAAAALP